MKKLYQTFGFFWVLFACWDTFHHEYVRAIYDMMWVLVTEFKVFQEILFVGEGEEE